MEKQLKISGKLFNYNKSNYLRAVEERDIPAKSIIYIALNHRKAIN